MSNKLLIGFSALLATVSLGYLYFDSLAMLFGYWMDSEDYSHGVFVPLISLFLIWQARYRIAEAGTQNSWWGLAVIFAGLFLFWVGEFSTLYVLEHLSLWMVIVGLVIALIGVPAAQAIAFPLSYLLMSIPLPAFLYANLSSQLQLWSSALGVSCLQLVGVSAFRDGNIIDLGPVQLQVVEACSGIRYLLPLTALALLCAYLYKDKMWKRVVLVLSSIPISILVNGFRIGMIGVLVEWYGESGAEGFSHLFEGWVLFMTSLGLLIIEMGVLAKVGSNGEPVSLLDRFTWMDRSSSYSTSEFVQASISPRLFVGPAYMYSIALLVSMALPSTYLGERKEVPPERALFVDFPMQIDGWIGNSMPLEKQYIDGLRFDDYVLAEYRIEGSQPITFYSAYYRSQRKGQSAHSPQSCLPGGGWEISSLKLLDLPSGGGMTHTLHANRAVIQKDNQKQIVLYWFKQRDRILTNEYLVKFYLLWDALLRRRTDGALMRIASLVEGGETEDIIDQRMRQFLMVLEPELNRYVPD